MRVLLTGGAGFLGSHVADVLQFYGHEVTVFDQQPCNRPHVVGDLLNLDDIARALQGMDAVCHLAAIGDVYLAFEKPYLASACNVTGTANVAEGCLQAGVKKLVYASTWEVYGEPRYQPVDEEHPKNPDHPYNITKLAGEQIALSYDRLKGLPVVALRLGTAYGLRMRPNSVFSIFVRRAVSGEALVIKGTGEQGRQFTHVRDIGRAFAQAVASHLHGEAFNIVAAEMITIRELAGMVADAVGAKIVFEESRVGDIATAIVSNQKAEEKLGWTPLVSFQEGLAELIQSTTGSRVPAAAGRYAA